MVVAKRLMTEEQYNEFDSRYQTAKLALSERAARVAAVVESLERDMELLSVTGVEDRLQVSRLPSSFHQKNPLTIYSILHQYRDSYLTPVMYEKNV